MKKIILSMLVAAAGLQANAQFQQNFDSGTTMPTGWATINGGDPNEWLISNNIVNGAHSGSNAASIGYHSTIAHDDYLIMPQIAVTANTNDRVSFWIKSRSASFLEPYEVVLSTTNNTSASAFTMLLQPEEEAPSDWVKKTFDLSNFVGQNVYIAIRATGLNEYNLYVDDVVNDAIPLCSAPTDLAASVWSTTSATLEWAGTGNFEIEYGPAGFALGTGETATTSDNSLTLSTLSANTAYQFYVRIACDPTGYSEWAGPFAFTTPCEATTVLNETFESTPTSTVMPDCWSRKIVSTSTAPYVYVSSSDVYAGSRALRFGCSSDASATLYATSPQLSNVPAMTHRVRFWVKGSASATLEVGAILDPNNPALFESLKTIEITTSFVQHTVDFNVPTNANYIAFKASFASTSTYISIDNVVWEPIPTCPDVPGLAVDASSITSNSATITWDSVANGYQYALGLAADTDPNTLTAVDNVLNSATLSLAPQTTYKVWVRSDCGTEFGAWSQPISFTTLCAPIDASALPWTEGFEGVATVGTNSFPPCWFKQNGDWRTSNAGSSSYDSNARTGTNFVTNSWTADNEYLWTPGFNLVEGESYDFSFWYASYGSYSTWEGDVFVNTTQSSANATPVGDPFVWVGLTAPNTYTEVIRPFVAPATGTYYFAIRVNETSGNPWYLSFDDFKLDASSLGTPDVAAGQFKFYPNPVKNTLNIANTEAIDTVEVYNLLGQMVMTKKINATEASLDFSALQSGTYIVKAASANAIKTIKIAKQ